MKWALNVPMTGEADQLVELGVLAEGAGWDAFFLWDHVQLDADARPDVHDPWVLLGAIAARTERIRLGTMVTPLPRRRPWKLAREVVTLDHLSGGRAILGVGIGAPPEAEFGVFGESSDARTRAAKLDEALPILDALLRGDRVDHDGEHYQVHAEFRPASRQRPRPPIWVAGGAFARRPMERAKQWDGYFPINQSSDVLDPAETAALVERLGPVPDGFDIVIAPGEHRDAVAEYERCGVTWLVDVPDPAESSESHRHRVEAGPGGGPAKP